MARGGGSQEKEVAAAEKVNNEDDDDERYSRQVYTLGARAHGLVRTATIFVDGPATSGLVYECVKDLALSGVGNIVLWDSNSNHDVDSIDAHYHDASLDDLDMATRSRLTRPTAKRSPC